MEIGLRIQEKSIAYTRFNPTLFTFILLLLTVPSFAVNGTSICHLRLWLKLHIISWLWRLSQPNYRIGMFIEMGIIWMCSNYTCNTFRDAKNIFEPIAQKCFFKEPQLNIYGNNINVFKLILSIPCGMSENFWNHYNKKMLFSQELWLLTR